MRYVVQQEVKVSDSKGWGPQASRHEMHDDLVGKLVVLERGKRPVLRVLGIVDSSDGIRCFARVMTGPSRGSTAAFPLCELGPYVEDLPHDRWAGP